MSLGVHYRISDIVLGKENSGHCVLRLDFNYRGTARHATRHHNIGTRSQVVCV